MSRKYEVCFFVTFDNELNKLSDQYKKLLVEQLQLALLQDPEAY